MLFTLTPSAPGDGYGEALLPLDDLKAWLRVLSNDEDELIEALRDAAINMVEQYCNLRMGPCTGMVATFEGFGMRMRPGIGPASTMVVTGVRYVDHAGVESSIADGGWRIGPDGGLTPRPGTFWPCNASAVVVTFNVGFPADTCPPVLVTAAKMFATHLYENRSTVITGTITAEIRLGFRVLCDPYRMPVL